MKAKQPQFTIGQEVILPNGETGVVVDILPVGELEIMAEHRDWFLYPEDVKPKEDAP